MIRKTYEEFSCDASRTEGDHLKFLTQKLQRINDAHHALCIIFMP